jgi:V-type H+-transporting ATPase subunit D
VSGKKQRDTAAADAELKANQQRMQEAEERADATADKGTTDILAQHDEEDVIF